MLTDGEVARHGNVTHFTVIGGEAARYGNMTCLILRFTGGEAARARHGSMTCLQVERLLDMVT